MKPLRIGDLRMHGDKRVITYSNARQMAVISQREHLLTASETARDNGRHDLAKVKCDCCQLLFGTSDKGAQVNSDYGFFCSACATTARIRYNDSPQFDIFQMFRTQVETRMRERNLYQLVFKDGVLGTQNKRHMEPVDNTDARMRVVRLLLDPKFYGVTNPVWAQLINPRLWDGQIARWLNRNTVVRIALRPNVLDSYATRWLTAYIAELTVEMYFRSLKSLTVRHEIQPRYRVTNHQMLQNTATELNLAPAPSRSIEQQPITDILYGIREWAASYATPSSRSVGDHQKDALERLDRLGFYFAKDSRFPAIEKVGKILPVVVNQDYTLGLWNTVLACGHYIRLQRDNYEFRTYKHIVAQLCQIAGGIAMSPKKTAQDIVNIAEATMADIRASHDHSSDDIRTQVDNLHATVRTIDVKQQAIDEVPEVPLDSEVPTEDSTDSTDSTIAHTDHTDHTEGFIGRAYPMLFRPPSEIQQRVAHLMQLRGTERVEDISLSPYDLRDYNMSLNRRPPTVLTYQQYADLLVEGKSPTIMCAVCKKEYRTVTGSVPLVHSVGVDMHCDRCAANNRSEINKVVQDNITAELSQPGAKRLDDLPRKLVVIGYPLVLGFHYQHLMPMDVREKMEATPATPRYSIVEYAEAQLAAINGEHPLTEYTKTNFNLETYPDELSPGKMVTLGMYELLYLITQPNLLVPSAQRYASAAIGNLMLEQLLLLEGERIEANTIGTQLHSFRPTYEAYMGDDVDGTKLRTQRTTGMPVGYEGVPTVPTVTTVATAHWRMVQSVKVLLASRNDIKDDETLNYLYAFTAGVIQLDSLMSINLTVLTLLKYLPKLSDGDRSIITSFLRRILLNAFRLSLLNMNPAVGDVEDYVRRLSV